jgi:hypothetical protein
MIPLRRILDKVRAVYPSCEVRYLHPSLYLVCEDEGFGILEREERRIQFFRKLGAEGDVAEAAFTASGVILELVTQAEHRSELGFLESAPAPHHWLEFLAGSTNGRRTKITITQPIIHFYGYKGGQARSTVLGMLSKSFANDGYRVLAVDADIEAPSLHAVFETRVVKPESTLLGCIQYGLEPSPQSVYVPKISSSQGRVDLIACKPSGPDYDLDLASFALMSALNPNVIQLGFERILNSCRDFDVVLIDHRSGLASTVLPLAATFPGPVVVCVRLDEHSDEADGFFKTLFDQNPELPGLYLSFSLDPEDSIEKLMGRNRQRIEVLLGALSDAIARGAFGDGEALPTDPEDLGSYWVPWFHDRSFLVRGLPDIENISADNRGSLSKIRELTGLQSPKKGRAAVASSLVTSQPRQLTNSGNTDQGLLIQTDTLRKLLAPNSPYTYILGRKGTGKTRLVKTLVDKKQGRPLLVADDFPAGDATLSSDAGFKDLTDLLPLADAEKLWWILLDVAVSSGRDQSREQLLRIWLQALRAQGPIAASIDAISGKLQSIRDPQVFLIDGVETAFTSAKMRSFVEGLFRFLSAVQSNTQTSQKITVRLFIRTDLARQAVENVEQQIEGRALTISWDTQSILNFALTRIYDLEWFRQQFPDTTGRIGAELDRLADGAVPEAQCNEFLLEIFPLKIRRNNLLTLTFLKDYFSEGLGESASFYPRIYDTFLRSIAEPANIGPTAARSQQVRDARVAQPLIIAAHDYASKEYLKQVAAELKNLLRLSDDSQENQERVGNLIDAFTGLPTPFKFDECLAEVSRKLRNSFKVGSERVREALLQMKRVGIFEDRPGYAGWWRAGRLFKNALGMKYVR